jgi:hypothetical protein
LRLRKILDWFNGWCPKETLMSHPHPVSRSRERLTLVGQIAFFGSGLALVSLSLLITPIYTSDHEILVRMETIDQAWQTATENTVTFRSNPLSRLLTTYKVKITHYYEYDSEEGRLTKVTYRIYSNGFYVDEITHSYDIGQGGGGGWYDPVSIPSGTLRAGENTMKVQISFNSTANEPRTRSDSFEFQIYSEVVTNNYRLTALIVLLFASVVFIMARKGRGAGP